MMSPPSATEKWLAYDPRPAASMGGPARPRDGLHADMARRRPDGHGRPILPGSLRGISELPPATDEDAQGFWSPRPTACTSPSWTSRAGDPGRGRHAAAQVRLGRPPPPPGSARPMDLAQLPEGVLALLPAAARGAELLNSRLGPGPVAPAASWCSAPGCRVPASRPSPQRWSSCSSKAAPLRRCWTATSTSPPIGGSRLHPFRADTSVLRIGRVATQIAKHGGIAACAPIARYAKVRDASARRSRPRRGGAGRGGAARPGARGNVIGLLRGPDR
jgi:hypothetical protein